MLWSDTNAATPLGALCNFPVFNVILMLFFPFLFLFPFPFPFPFYYGITPLCTPTQCCTP